MPRFAQYWEDDFLSFFFKDKDWGFVVDVGAADGVTGSNSRGLLLRGWSGILIEPEKKQYEALKELYKDYKYAMTLNCAIGTKPGEGNLFTCAQVSTLDETWKKRCEEFHGVSYGFQPIQIFTLTEILERTSPKEIDFLSIDAEGMDGDVWNSLDKSKWSPRLVCMEGHHWAFNGYREVHRTAGNILLERLDK